MLLAACSKPAKVAVGHGDADPEMAAAIARAQATLPQFWQVYENHEHSESNFTLIVRIADKGRVEHFTVTHFAQRDGKTMVTIDNTPKIVTNVKSGDEIEIPPLDITDWSYMYNGKYVGMQRLRVYLKDMPPAEVERIKATLADP